MPHLNADQRSNFLTTNRLDHIALLPQVKNKDREVVVHTSRDRGCVHDSESLFENLELSDPVNWFSLRIGFRVRSV